MGRPWPYLSLRVIWHKATIRDGSCVKKLPALRAWAGALIGKLFSPISHYFQNTAISLCALKAKWLAFSSMHTALPVHTALPANTVVSANNALPVNTVIPAKAGIPSLSGKKGMGLAEVLVAGAVGGVIIAGSMKSLSLSMQSAQVARSSLSESDMRHSISQILSNTGDCLANFDPTPTPNTVPTDPEQASALGLYGDNRDWAVGEVVRLAKTLGNSDNTDDVALLKKGVAFKGDLEIVQMELKGSLASSPPDSDKTVLKKAVRNFVVFYKKVGMGGYSTLGGEPCTTSNKAGCYFSQCTVEYQRDDDDSTSTDFTKICSVSDCVSYGSGGGGANCYQVDDGDGSGEGRTLVGCGGTNKVAKEKTTAFGYSAGSSVSTGGSNTFIGYKAGSSVSTGNRNTVMGYEAGFRNTGYRNTFIGNEAGRGGGDSATGPAGGYRNTIIGDGAGYYLNTGDDNTLIGRNAGVGTSSANTITSGNSNIAIGSGVTVPSGTGHRQINIGNVVLGQAQSTSTSTPSFASPDSSKNDIRVMGKLQVCNNDGSVCKEVVTTSGSIPSCTGSNFLQFDSSTGRFTCSASIGSLLTGSCNPAGGSFFRGFDSNGRASCQSAQYAGDSHTHPSSQIVSALKNKSLELKNLTVTDDTKVNQAYVKAIRTEKSNQTIAIHAALKAKSLDLRYSPVGGSGTIWAKAYWKGDSFAPHSGGTWLSSDRRLKTKIVKLQKTLEKVNQLKPYSFRWKNPAHQEEVMLPKTHKNFGFMAQDVKKILPEIVRKNHTGFFKLKIHGVDTFYCISFSGISKKHPDRT